MKSMNQVQLMNESQRKFRTLTRQFLRQHTYLAGAVILLVGIILKLLSINKVSFIWQVLGESGSLLIILIAISFIYDRLIRMADRQVFLSDLEDVLDTKLRNFKDHSTDIKLHERGRRSISEKIEFIRTAKSEVIILGIALRSFCGYFEQRASYEFKDHVIDLLRHGVDFKCLVFDPNCKIAKEYIENMNEAELLNRIDVSLRCLKNLNDEFKQLRLRGKFEIYTYSHIPTFHAVCIDGDMPNGRIFISPYMFGIKRAETPGLEFPKYQQPDLFEKFWLSIQKIVTDSHEYI